MPLNNSQPIQNNISNTKWATEIQKGANIITSDQALADLSNGIWDLVDANRLDQLNILLQRMDVTKMSWVGIESILRYTYSVRMLLDEWPDLLNRASVELNHRFTIGETDRILSGLKEG